MILVSGATGALGPSFLAALGEPAVVALRGSDHERRAAWLARRSGVEVRGLPAEITAPGWGIDAATLDELRGTVRLVVHLAAETDWGTAWERMERTNVRGAENAVDVARAVGAPLVHASTLFVGYGSGGVVPERLLPESPWLTKYERSKCRAEWVVQEARNSGLEATIVRIGALVGDLDPAAGRPTVVRAPLLRLLRRLEWPVMPICPTARIDMVPRDVAAKAVARVCADPGALDPPVHHVGLGPDAPTIGSLAAEIRAVLLQRGVDRNRPLPVRASWLRQAALQADRFGTTPRTTALIGLRYLADDSIYAVSQPLDRSLSVADLVRCIGLRTDRTPSTPLPEFYAEWPLHS